MHWESNFSNKAKVTLILHAAYSENDINMTVGKCMKRSIIENHEFKDFLSGISSEAERGSCGLMDRVGLVTQRSRVRVSGPAGIVGGGGGVNDQRSLHPQYHD